MADLEENVKDLLFPPRFVFNVVRTSECTKDLNTTIKISLHKEGKVDEAIQLKLYVPITASFIEGQDNSLLLVNPVHVCKQNKPELKDLHSEYGKVNSEQPCNVPSPGTDKHNVHTKLKKQQCI